MIPCCVDSRPVRILLAITIAIISTGCRKPAPRPAEVDPDLFEFDMPSVEVPEYAVTTAPDFVAPTLDGGVFRMRDALGGVTLINFWATWCAPCVAETPELVELYDDYRSNGLIVVGVSLDDEGFEAVRGFADEYGVAYPMILDEGLSNEFGGLYGLPMSFLIEPGGDIVERYVGRVPADALRQRIADLIAPQTDSG